MQVESRTLQLGCEQGLFEKTRQSAGSANRGDFIPGAVSDCGAGHFRLVGGAGLFRSGQGGAAHLGRFLGCEEVSGQSRGLRRSAKYTLEIALLADGVAPADVYPMLATDAGLERAFRKLDQIKSDTIWWEAAAQPGVQLSGRQPGDELGLHALVRPRAAAQPAFQDRLGREPVRRRQLGHFRRASPQADRGPTGFIAFASAPETPKRCSPSVCPMARPTRKPCRCWQANLAKSLPIVQVEPRTRVEGRHRLLGSPHGRGPRESDSMPGRPQICRQQDR